MIGTVLAVGAGTIRSEEIIDMLQSPNPQNWNNRCASADPEGLFLKSIEYKNLEVLRGMIP